MSSGTPRVRTRRLCKEFAIHHGQLTAAQLVRRLVGGGSRNARRLTALENVDFEVYDGEMVGIVGNNGAGKTTLLKLIAGIYAPTAGQIEVAGEVALLSGLGVGMLGDLTVTENIFLYGAICRLPRARIEELFDEIIEWAELGNFESAPLRTLSTGMGSRLAFSIAKHIEVPVVLMDEALTAGDERFKRRCDEYFEGRTNGRGVTVVASHGLEFVQRFCSKTLWLRYGEQVAFGPTAEVLARYREWAARSSAA